MILTQAGACAGPICQQHHSGKACHAYVSVNVRCHALRVAGLEQRQLAALCSTTGTQ